MPQNLSFLYFIYMYTCIWMHVFEEWTGRVGWVKYDKTDFPLVPVSPIIQHDEIVQTIIQHDEIVQIKFSLSQTFSQTGTASESGPNLLIYHILELPCPSVPSFLPWSCFLPRYHNIILFWVFQIWEWAAGHSKTLGWWMAGGIWNRCHNHWSLAVINCIYHH